MSFYVLEMFDCDNLVDYEIFKTEYMAVTYAISLIKENEQILSIDNYNKFATMANSGKYQEDF